ncbi:hypothetical protein DM30_04115 [Brucella abortus]|nr:hypothetical protein DM30_04115 [Brucella abortus]KFJ46474.1 hypothetical protein DK47_556 [Brucella abortus 2308]OLS07024.1 hypothetical protein AT961_11395 [Brucella abortus]
MAQLHWASVTAMAQLVVTGWANRSGSFVPIAVKESGEWVPHCSPSLMGGSNFPSTSPEIKAGQAT